MRGGQLGALVLACLIAGACSPAPPSTASDGAACGPDLPPRTSPTDYPLAVLHAAGDDLPPVVGEVEWLGGDRPLATTAPRPVNLARFTVLQVRGLSEVSVRMTDGVAISAWSVDAFDPDAFRAGEAETGAEWVRGDRATDLVCVPIRDGDWVIRADLTFADGSGVGTYYWRLNVTGTPGP